jgi:hypothetical protein
MKPNNLNLQLLTGRHDGFGHTPWNRGLHYQLGGKVEHVWRLRNELRLHVSDYHVLGPLGALWLVDEILPFSLRATGEFDIPFIAAGYAKPSRVAFDRSRWAYVANVGAFDNPSDLIHVRRISDNTCEIILGDHTYTATYTYSDELLSVASIPGIFAAIRTHVDSWPSGATLSLPAPRVNYPYARVASMLRASESAIRVAHDAGMAEEFFSASSSELLVGIVAAAIILSEYRRVFGDAPPSADYVEINALRNKDECDSGAISLDGVYLALDGALLMLDGVECSDLS